MIGLSSFCRTGIRALIVIAFTLGAQAASAEMQCSDKDVSKWTADSAREAKLCLQKLKDFTARECDRALCKEIEVWRAKPRDKAVAEASVLLAKVRDGVVALVGTGFREALPLQREIERWLRDLTLARPEDLRSANQGPYRAQSVEVWAYNSAAQKVLEHQQNEINLGKVLDDACISTGRCEQALRGDAEIVVHSTMVQIISGKLLDDLRQDASAYVDMLDKRWENYFSTSRFQYPWELAINDRRFNTQGRAGFVSPPEDQVIFLHPSAGVRYDSNSTSKYEPTLVLELAGYYRWKWDKADPAGLVGGSIVTTWTNESGERKPGWGAIAHFKNNYSIGFTMTKTPTGNRTSLLLSIDLAKLFQDKDALKKRLQGL